MNSGLLICTYNQSASSGSGAWTVVGPGGKPVAAAVTSAASTVPASSRLSTVSARPAAATATSAPASRSAGATVSSSSGTGAKKADDKMHPSADFMRWLRDALRGLNNGVSGKPSSVSDRLELNIAFLGVTIFHTVEDFITMLFELPLDLDSSMMDVISDFVYANSSTMDGRRFASEFVNKRKADVKSKGNEGSGSGRPSSLADGKSLGVVLYYCMF